MSLESFAQQLHKMKYPRARRGFLDSFYAGLVHGKIEGLDIESIDKAAVLLETYGFPSHARKLQKNPHYRKLQSGQLKSSIENLAQAASLWLCAAGDGLHTRYSRLPIAMYLFALPNEELKGPEYHRVPSSIRANAKYLLERTPEERCRQLLDWMSEGMERRGFASPAQSLYRSTKSTCPKIPMPVRDTWETILAQYKAEHQLTE